MSAKEAAPEAAEAPAKKGGKKKLILIALPVLLLGAGAGLWFTGILPGLLGMGPPPEEHAAAEGGDGHGEAAAGGHGKAAPAAASGGHGAPAAASGGHGGGGHGAPAAAAPVLTPSGTKGHVFFDMPEIVANLNTGGRKTTYIRLRSKLELARAADADAVQANMPRLLDLYTTYLREMRPEELRGSAGTQRLREELIARASIVAAPAKVTDVLFTELLLQ